MTPERRLAIAKINFTEAAAAALRGDPDAPVLAEKSLAEINKALAELDVILEDMPA